MTDPQASRISSFWQAADPEGKDRTFRRAIGPDTLDAYIRQWVQMLTFCWKGWQRQLFPESLAELERIATHAAPARVHDDISSVGTRGDRADDDDSSESNVTSSD